MNVKNQQHSRKRQPFLHKGYYPYLIGEATTSTHCMIETVQCAKLGEFR